jgi:putative membrane protein
MFRVTALGVAFIALCLLTWQSQAQDKDKAPADAEFAFKASAMDLAEINLGQLATQRAASAAVKAYGQQMVEDHTKSSTELLKIASDKGLKVAKKMDKKHAALAEELSSLNGEQFDKAYMMHMLMDHKKALALFQQQAQNGTDAELKAFAAKGVPIIEDHLKKAQQLSGGKGKAKADQ